MCLFRRLWLALAAFVALQSSAYAAGSLNCTTQMPSTQYIVYTCAWTATSGGAVSGNPFPVAPGIVVQVKFKPGTGGSQPTSGYGVAINDADGADVLGGVATGLSNTVASWLVSSPGPVFPFATTFDVVVSGAGNATSGTVIITMERKGLS